MTSLTSANELPLGSKHLRGVFRIQSHGLITWVWTLQPCEGGRKERLHKAALDPPPVCWAVTITAINTLSSLQKGGWEQILVCAVYCFFPQQLGQGLELSKLSTDSVFFSYQPMTTFLYFLFLHIYMCSR